MKNNRGCGTTALLIGLILLFTVLSAVLFMEVDGERRMICTNISVETNY